MAQEELLFFSGVEFMADEQIRQARARGDFDNLPGRGQPLRLPLPRPGTAANHPLYQVLLHNGFILPWIEEKREIEGEMAAARDQLERAWLRHDGSQWAEAVWQQAMSDFQEQTTVLKQRILTFNLKAPVTRLHLYPLNPAREIQRIQGSMPRPALSTPAPTTSPVQPTRGQHRALLSTYLHPLAGKVALLALFLFAHTGLRLVNPQILRSFIDTALAGGAATALADMALLFIGVVIFTQAATAVAMVLTEDVGWRATNALRTDLALRVLKMDLSFHQERPPGELIERVDGDVAALHNFFSQFVLRVLGSGLLLAGILVLLGLEDVRVGTAVFAYVLVAGIIFYHIRNLAVPAFRADRQKAAEVLGFWEERLLGTADLRANGAIPTVMRRQHQLMRQVLLAARQAALLGYAVHGTYIVLDGIGYALAFAVGAYFYYAGSLTIGTAYLIFHYMSLLTWNLRVLVFQLDDLQRATASIIRINELHQARSRLGDGLQTDFPAGAVSVTFDDVSFSYTAGKTTLRHISFRLQPGQVLGLLGHTGSGKSTVVRLLFRFYDPDSGVIRLDGVDLRQWQLAALRQGMGMVTQSVQLFQATVRDNLTFFDESVPDARILKVIQQLGLRPWYDALPHGLDTMLGADGAGLSAGEAQLLAFTRVFLQDPGLVILDEPSSRLDPVTEQLVERAMDQLLQDRTAVVIAHRLHTVQRADEIIILENGGIAEQGPTHQLTADPDSRFNELLQIGLL
jgi:ABC-type multidrug transport system fused ATPase/permease subunit